MDTKLLLALIAATGVAALGVAYRRFRSRNLPDLSDEAFLTAFDGFRHLGREAVLDQRCRVAKTLGIPTPKLSPEQSLKDLSKYFGFLGEFSVAWSDLEDEAREIQRQRGTPKEESPLSTVGELVAVLAQGNAPASDQRE